MTWSGTAFQQYCFSVLLLAVIFGANGESHAQGEIQAGERAATVAIDRDEAATVNRGGMRLQLLLSLVQNELRAAMESKTQLTTERRALETERKKLSTLGDRSRPADRFRSEEIERRLVQLNEELAAVDARLPDVTSELEALQRRLDEANGIVRDTGETTAATDADEAQPSSSQWLDSNRRVQEALVYLGGYNALIDGDLGPRTREAVRAYQARQALEPTGELTEEQQSALLAEADAWRALYGMRPLVDEETGYRLSYPSSLLLEVEEIDPGTRRMATVDGESELLITTSNGSTDIVSMYASVLGEYEVQYRRKRDSWYVVAGLADDGRIIYDTARQTENGIIRARLTYPEARRELWSPFAVMMFNTFEALPRSES